MKVLIISSSLHSESRSLLLCRSIEEKLKKLDNEIELVDAKDLELLPYSKGPTKSMQELEKKVEWADSIIFGMGIYNYSVSDSLKIILDNCLGEAKGKFFGILCAAGGQRSYLATMQLTQICMNQWRMIQLPRVVYATGADFNDDEITNQELIERLDLFANEFDKIGKKLTN